MKFLSIFALMLLLLPPNAVGGPFEDAKAAADHRDFKTALKIWQPLAEQGNPRAEYNLGLLYLYGYGVNHDDAESLKWFRMSADQGNADAMYYIGQAYTEGRGVKRDEAEARKWFRRAMPEAYPDIKYDLPSTYPAVNCSGSDGLCILKEAVRELDPSQIKTDNDQKNVLYLVRIVARHGDDYSRKLFLTKIQKISESLIPVETFFPPIETPEYERVRLNSLLNDAAIEKLRAEALLTASVGNIPESVALLKKLKEKDPAIDIEDKPHMVTVDLLTDLGRLDVAKEYLRDTRYIDFKSNGRISSFKNAASGPESKLIMAYLAQDRLKDALEVNSLLQDDNAYTTKKERALSVDPHEWIKFIFASYYAAKGMNNRAKEMQSQITVGCGQYPAGYHKPDRFADPDRSRSSPIEGQILDARDRIVDLINFGKIQDAQNYFDGLQSTELAPHRSIVIGNIRVALINKKIKDAHSAKGLSFYLDNCRSLSTQYYHGGANARCFFDLLFDVFDDNDKREPSKFQKKYWPNCGSGYYSFHGLDHQKDYAEIYYQELIDKHTGMYGDDLLKKMYPEDPLSHLNAKQKAETEKRAEIRIKQLESEYPNSKDANFTPMP
jgi:TPR repeat protein